MASYIARFECAICQGTCQSAEFGALSCGHAFHTSCVQTWLARSSSCPSCRASANKRGIRVLAGIDNVLDAGGDAAAMELTETQQQVKHLQQQLDDAQAQVEAFKFAAEQLDHEHQVLHDKLKASKKQCKGLEAGRLQDGQRLSELNAELSQWKDRYWTETERLQTQLQYEQRKQRQAAADIKRLKLQNPSLSLAAMQQICGAQHEEQADLMAVLAQRNQQLQEAQSSVSMLQQQLEQKQVAATAQVDAVQARFRAMESKAAKDKEEQMKAVLQLEYANGKLQQENQQLNQQLQELQDVLLALQRAPQQQQQACQQPQQKQQQQRRQFSKENVPPAVPLVSHLQSFQQKQQQQCSEHSKKQDCSSHSRSLSHGGPDARKIQPSSCSSPLATSSPLQPDDEDVGDDPWATQLHCEADLQQQQQQIQQTQPGGSADVDDAGWAVMAAAAVGPGSLLKQTASAAQMPSFMKTKVTAASGGSLSVSGHVVRHGPDGRGSTTRHLVAGFTAAGKRGPAPNVSKPHNKKSRKTEQTNSILSFFGGGGTKAGSTSSGSSRGFNFAL